VFRYQCVDVDECELGIGCGPGAICTNIIGNRLCECPPGYEGEPYTTGCSDMNECNQRDVCGRGALCENMPGSFKCTCLPGLRGDPIHGCAGKVTERGKLVCDECVLITILINPIIPVRIHLQNKMSNIIHVLFAPALIFALRNT
jgi:hypothetical protein